MEVKSSLSKSQRHTARKLAATLCTVLLVPDNNWVIVAGTQASQQQGAASDQQAPKIPDAQLDSLVAPIALYPDPLLAQVLAASTYPLEIVQLQQWLVKNKNLKDKALVDAVSKQPWDPSIQGMVGLPDVVKRLSDDIQWTTDLGNAFLAQQSDVMDAVQRMRKKAQDAGSLKSNEQQKVETKVVENKTVVVVEQANPQVVYVPSYSPTVVYGPPVYPYPPIYYPPPPSTGAVIATAAISFGVGVAMGAAWGGGWGYGCGWGGNDVDINVNNNFNRNTNISNSGNRTNVSNRTANTSNKFQHNPQHRGGAPYSNQATANKFGGTARGDSLSQRQSSARQQTSRQGGNLSSSSRAGSGAGGGAGVSNRAGGAGVSDRAGGASASNRASGGGDRVGSRDVSSRSGGGDRGALGSSGGYSGSSARSSSSRGSSSMGASRGGGGRGGGGRRR
jgi:hypothetical protein